MQRVPVATTGQGRVSGSVDDRGILSYKAIPYAQPPVGALRFKPPIPALGWPGVRDGSLPGPMAMQSMTALEHAMGVAERSLSEDCCYLDVWTPSLTGRRPTMVWLHGGAFLNGSGSAPVYDGSALADSQDVVIVTCNYRMGAFGFLALQNIVGEQYLGSANAGLLDQLQVLRWVNENINSFGGDANNVCVFGESAGAISIGAMLAMPEAKGLFSSAILQSGTPWGVTTLEQAENITRTLLARMGLSSDDAALIQQAPVEHILAAQNELVVEHPLGMPFAPVHDGHILAEHPAVSIMGGSSTKVAIMVGTNADETKLFRLLFPQLLTVDDKTIRFKVRQLFGDKPGDILLERYCQMISGQDVGTMWETLLNDMLFNSPAIQLLEAHSRQGGTAYNYSFSWKTPTFGGMLGACHALEVPFVFGNLDKPGVSAFTGDGPERRFLSNAMVGAWANFARSHEPFDDNLPKWSPYSASNRVTMRLDKSPELVEDIFGPRRALWDGVTPWGVIRSPNNQ